MQTNQATIGNVLLKALEHELDGLFYVKGEKRTNSSSRVRQYDGKQERTAIGADSIRPEFAHTAPGSKARIAELAAFYGAQGNEGQSAFVD